MRGPRTTAISPATASLGTLLLLAGFHVVRADDRDVAIHGFLSQGFLFSTDNNFLAETERGSFEFNEIGVNLGTELAGDLRIGLQLFARDLGALGNDEITLDWAFADWRRRDWLGLRAGQIRMPYGLYNETADIDAVRTSVLLPQSVYSLRLRDLLVSVTGVDVYGNIPFGGGSGGSFDYRAFAGAANIADDGSVAQFFNDAGAFTVTDVENVKVWGGAAIWEPPLEGLRIGATVSHYEGRIDVDVSSALQQGFGLPPTTTLTTDNTYFRVYSVDYGHGPWALASEYARWVGDFENAYFPSALDAERYYASASYRIDDRFEVGSYYSVTYPDRSDRDGNNSAPRHRAWQKDLALSLRVDLTSHWIFKLEAHDVDGTASVYDQANPNGTTRDWRYFAAKLSVAF